MSIRIQLLRENATYISTDHGDDIGIDLYACLDQPITIYAGEQQSIATGLAIDLPPLVAGWIVPVRDLVKKYQLTIADAPSFIAPGDNDEIIVLLRSFGKRGVTRSYVVNPGDLIARLIFMPMARHLIRQVNSWDELNVTPDKMIWR